MSGSIPAHKISWADLRKLVLLGPSPSDAVSFLRDGGRIDWTTVDQPHKLILDCLKTIRFGAEHTALVETLRLARKEFSEGGRSVFTLHEGQPVRRIIVLDDSQLFLEFLGAGLDPLSRESTNGKSALELARAAGSHSVASIIHAHLASRAASDALEDINRSAAP